MEKKFLFYFLFITSIAVSQNKSFNRTDSLLSAIAKLQSPGTEFYRKGMFPSQRGKGKLKDDNTVFFTSLISFTLQNSKTNLSVQNRRLADSICAAAIANYSCYQNKTGIATYNFWQTNPPQFFPNSRFLSRHKRFNIPDDADCTVFVYLTDTAMNAHVQWLKNKLTDHANRSHSKIKNTYKEYRNLKAYSTWFGKKMPVEFDICVLSNILYFVLEKRLPLNMQDEESAALIRSVILSKKHLNNAYYVSPSYRKPAIVLYHLARLMEKNQIPLLNDCMEIIKNDIEQELEKPHPFMERVILSTALLKMGGNPEALVWPLSLEKEMSTFDFFDANLFAPYARPSLRFISKSRLFVQPFYCKAYCLALLLEYESLMNSRQ